MAEVPDAGAVVHVGSRTGPTGLVQVWRYRTTGRTVEVAEANAYAPSDELGPHAEGFVVYERGVPVVVRRPGDRPARPPTRPTATRPAAAGSRRRRGFRVAPSAWALLVLLAIVIALAWGR